MPPGANSFRVDIMSTYHAPLADMQFVMNELAGLAQVASLPGFEDATPDTVTAILEEASKFATEVLDRERVEVGPERDHRPVLAADLGDEPAAREQPHRHTLLVEPLGHECGGALLLPRQLGMGVQVPAQADELVVDRRDDTVDVGEVGGG